MTAAATDLATDVEPATPIRQGVRLSAIDVLRGLVIVLMVVDHVREFFHYGALHGLDPLDVRTTSPLLYLTRWATHFCAPTFVFLAGASSWLQLNRGKTPAELSWFLFSRGLWLVILEFTVINLAWGFQIGLPFLQVIWVIGASMMLMSLMVWLPARLILLIGVVIVAGHNALTVYDRADFGALTPLWTLLHHPGMLPVGEAPGMLEIYPLLPWFGVFCLGYGLSFLFVADEARRDRNFVVLGLAMIAAFAALRVPNLYGDTGAWAAQDNALRTVGDFMNLQKYPPSLDYVLATLGPVLALMPLWSRMKGRIGEFFMTYGRVPLFAYVLHLFIAHGLEVLLGLATGQPFRDFQNIALDQSGLQDWGWPIGVVYLVWASVLAILYPLCRWFGRVKRERKDWWLSYL
jgi:uncharacterized membrane protein